MSIVRTPIRAKFRDRATKSVRDIRCRKFVLPEKINQRTPYSGCKCRLAITPPDQAARQACHVDILRGSTAIAMQQRRQRAVSSRSTGDHASINAVTAAWQQDLSDYRTFRRQKEQQYWNSRISDAAHNPRSLWNSLNVLLHSKNADPHFTANEFATSFHNKVKAIRDSTLDQSTRLSFLQLTAVLLRSYQSLASISVVCYRTLPEQAVCT